MPFSCAALQRLANALTDLQRLFKRQQPALDPIRKRWGRNLDADFIHTTCISLSHLDTYQERNEMNLSAW